MRNEMKMNEFIMKSIKNNHRLCSPIQRLFYFRQKRIEKPSTVKTDQVAQTDHQVDRVVYIDEPQPKQPSAATKAFVRNLGSSSVQQHMSWDSESLYSQQTNSDMFVLISYELKMILVFL